MSCFVIKFIWSAFNKWFNFNFIFNLSYYSCTRWMLWRRWKIFHFKMFVIRDFFGPAFWLINMYRHKEWRKKWNEIFWQMINLYLGQNVIMNTHEWPFEWGHRHNCGKFFLIWIASVKYTITLYSTFVIALLSYSITNP